MRRSNLSGSTFGILKHFLFLNSSSLRGLKGLRVLRELRGLRGVRIENI